VLLSRAGVHIGFTWPLGARPMRALALARALLCTEEAGERARLAAAAATAVRRQQRRPVQHQQRGHRALGRACHDVHGLAAAQLPHAHRPVLGAWRAPPGRAQRAGPSTCLVTEEARRAMCHLVRNSRTLQEVFALYQPVPHRSRCAWGSTRPAHQTAGSRRRWCTPGWSRRACAPPAPPSPPRRAAGRRTWLPRLPPWDWRPPACHTG